MLSEEMVMTLRGAVCAIGYLEAGVTGIEPNPDGPNFRVWGSGFVVRPSTIMTTRKILLRLRNEVDAKGIPRSRCRLLFEPRAEQGVQQYLCPLAHYGWIDNYTQNIALLDYVDPSSALGTIVTPLSFGERFAAAVGQSIGIIGYAFSAAALELDSDNGKPYMFRVGPILQQGFVSAIAPYETSNKISRLLLDLRSSPSMNGAPVVDTSTGVAIGMLYDTLERVSALAVPLDGPAMHRLIDSHDSARQSPTTVVIRAPAVPPETASFVHSCADDSGRACRDDRCGCAHGC